MATVTAAVGWGVYAGAAAPDLALGGSTLAPLLRLPPRALGVHPGAVMAAFVLAAVAVLLVTAAIALRGRLAVTAGPRPALWAAAVAGAAVLAAWSVDPWRLLLLGLGLAAAAWTPALLAGGRSAALAGSGVGAAAFVALAALPVLVPGGGIWLETLGRYPALVALPLGLGASRVLADEGSGKDGRGRA
jgi:hypothetical protein